MITHRSILVRIGWCIATLERSNSGGISVEAFPYVPFSTRIISMRFSATLMLARNVSDKSSLWKNFYETFDNGQKYLSSTIYRLHPCLWRVLQTRRQASNIDEKSQCHQHHCNPLKPIITYHLDQVFISKKSW